MEPCLELKLTGRQGHILVEGKAQDRFLDGNYVAFRLVLDQTELPVIANALKWQTRIDSTRARQVYKCPKLVRISHR